MNITKQKFLDAFKALPEDRRKEVGVYYSTSSGMGIVVKAKEDAQRVIDYADRRGYGYGEVGYNLDEAVKDFAEECPELEKEYDALVFGYFDLLTEAIEA
jgi:hypothetical protein